jgi:hypothetical protein
VTGRRPLVLAWRDAVRDSELRATVKLVAHTLSTYMDAGGAAFPSKLTIADGASLKSERAVDAAVLELEGAGFIDVSRSRGRSSNRYQAKLPTPHADAGFGGANPASDDSQPRISRRPTPHVAAGEIAEGDEVGALRASPAVNGGSARALAEDDCGRCGQRRLLVDDVYCADCAPVPA